MRDEQVKQELLNISRRTFLEKSAKTVAGVALAGSILSAVTPEVVFGNDTEAFEYTFKERSPESISAPMEYKKLDPEKCKERAYNAYKEKGG